MKSIGINSPSKEGHLQQMSLHYHSMTFSKTIKDNNVKGVRLLGIDSPPSQESGRCHCQANGNININYTPYNFISNNRDKAPGGTSILVKIYIPQSKIDLNIALLAVAIRA